MACGTCAESRAPHHPTTAIAHQPLPIDRHLPAIVEALAPGATVLLQADPGAGKTTRVPLALLNALAPGERVLMLEPRRLAARGAAERLAQGLGEAVGGQVGYSVRLERRISAATRLEVLTNGLFLRRLQADPALEGVACVIFDEFHERAAEADLALALTREARTLLRPDLRLLLMSATLDLEPLAAQLDGATVLRSEGRSHPVAVTHQPPRPGEPLPRQVLRALEQHWLDHREGPETVLVFLPGQREIQACLRLILEQPWAHELTCCPLHGQLPLGAQHRAIQPAEGAAGKVVLTTSIAESSLTIEGVRLVIDSGLCRISRFDPGTGMDGLVTQPASQASAKQRSGRAGRLGPGRALRLWSPAEQQRRPAFDAPELREIDPLPIALQLAAWGNPLGEDLPWLEPPAPGPLQEARQLLRELGALSADGRLSPHGRAMASLGLHPRLAHMLLRAQARGWLETATALAVLISERDPLGRQEAGADLLRRLDWLRAGSGGGPLAPMRRLQQQLRRQVAAVGAAAGASAAAAAPQGEEGAAGGDPGAAAETWQVAQLLAWAYPERLALARSPGEGRFLLRGGRGAWLPPEDPLAATEALAIASLDGQGRDARVLLAAPLPRPLLEAIASEEGTSESRAFWDGNSERLRCEQVHRLGALVLERRPLDPVAGDGGPDEAMVREALAEGLRRLGLEALPWTPAARQLQQRLALAHLHLGPPWPDRRWSTLLADPVAWLNDWIGAVRSRQDLQRIDLIEALWGDLAWERRRELERLLPPSLPVPSGRAVPLAYGEEDVVLAVKLQEMFGAGESPTVLEGRLPVTVHLLSPAGRPVAITRDLEGFWREGYGQVRRELRGRYPKHPWPEEPRQAVATALTRNRLNQQRQGPPP
ncbi:MAG: ATP-dependent helicase HrpB [Cyanobium sp.]